MSLIYKDSLTNILRNLKDYKPFLVSVLQASGSGKQRNKRIKLLRERMGHYEKGLYTDDLYFENNPVYKKAISLLPPEIEHPRGFRIARALLLDFKREELPKDEWITFEDDMQNDYMRPYVEYVESMADEVKEYGCDLTRFLPPTS